MKQLTCLLLACCCSITVFSQTITGVDYSLNWSSAKEGVPVTGKGIYILFREGLTLFDPATRKTTLYNQTDSNKTVTALNGLVVHNGKILV